MFRTRKQAIKYAVYLFGLSTGAILPKEPALGICSNVSHRYRDNIYGSLLVGKYVGTWKGFSGSEALPIKGPKGKRADNAYFSDLPKWSGDYGRSRKSLCRHIAKEICKEYNIDFNTVMAGGEE